MIRRHLDVRDHDVRAVCPGHLDQIARVSRGGDHVEPAVLEDAYDPFPDEGLVLTDYHANLLGRTHATKLCRRPGRRYSAGGGFADADPGPRPSGTSAYAPARESGIRACSTVPPPLN